MMREDGRTTKMKKWAAPLFASLGVFSVPAFAQPPAPIEVVRAFEDVKVSIKERAADGVVTVQVVKSDILTDLLSSLQRCANACQFIPRRQGEISDEEWSQWKGWCESFLSFTERKFPEAGRDRLADGTDDWRQMFDGIYNDWLAERTSGGAGLTAPFHRFAGRLKTQLDGLGDRLKALGVPHGEPIVMRQSTGFLIDTGIVVTTQEVAGPRNPNEWIRVYSEKQGAHSMGELIGKDSETNVAVIRLGSPGSELAPTIPFRRKADPPMGSFVLAFYHAFNQPLSMRTGEITGVNRRIPFFHCASFLETSLPTSPGTLGAPLVDLDGELVGMGNVFMIEGTLSEITYALPASQLDAVVDQIRRHGQVERGCIGVYVDEVHLSAGAKGVRVREVLPDSPAFRSGIRAGDIIRALDGKPVYCRTTLLSALSLKKPKDPVTLSVDRDGQPASISLELASLPPRPGQ